MADTTFIIIPSPDPSTVLWDSFPELREKFDDDDMGPGYLYDRFARHMISRRDDLFL